MTTAAGTLSSRPLSGCLSLRTCAVASSVVNNCLLAGDDSCYPYCVPPLVLTCSDSRRFEHAVVTFPRVGSFPTRGEDVSACHLEKSFMPLMTEESCVLPLLAGMASHVLPSIRCFARLCWFRRVVNLFQVVG